MNVTEAQFPLEIKKLTMKLDNLFNGNKVLGKRPSKASKGTKKLGFRKNLANWKYTSIFCHLFNPENLAGVPLIIFFYSGENMNRFLNENWAEILKDIKPALSGALASLTTSVLENVARLVPFDLLFPKKYDPKAPLP